MAKMILGNTGTPVTPALVKVVEPVISSLSVTPSTSAQTITAPSGTDGYSPINVSAVTSSIDANIVAGNIKNGVSILGVEGTYSGSGPESYMEFENNNGVLVKKIKQINISNISDPGISFSYLFNKSPLTENTVFSFSPITTITQQQACSYMFGACMTGNNYSLSVDLSSVKTITSGQCFQYAFSNTTDYTGTGTLSVDFSGLESITGTWIFDSAFRNSALKQISFNKLSVISQNFVGSSGSAPFYGCKKLESVSFGGIKSTTFSNMKTQIQYLFNSTSGSTATGGCTVHFPANFDPDNPNKTFDITTLSGYPTFGGDANYIHLAYDLPATE